MHRCTIASVRLEKFSNAYAHNNIHAHMWLSGWLFSSIIDIPLAPPFPILLLWNTWSLTTETPLFYESTQSDREPPLSLWQNKWKKPNTHLKHGPVTHNLDRRTARLRPPPLRYLPPPLPRRAFQHLCQGKLLRCKREFLADGNSDPITNVQHWMSVLYIDGEDFLIYSSITVIARHSTIAGCDGGTLGSPDTGSMASTFGLSVRTPWSIRRPPRWIWQPQ